MIFSPRSLLCFLAYWALLLESTTLAAAEEELLFDKANCQPGPHDYSGNKEPKKSPDSFNVRWKTTAAEEDIVLQVYRSWAPRGVDQFFQLVQDNYFNCAGFFRVVPKFVIQFGLASDPKLTAAWDHEIPDDPVEQSNDYGTLSFATAGPDTRTTQIFINLRDNHRLDKQGFAPFAKVVSGMEVLEQIYNPTPTDSGGVDQDKYKELGNEWLLSKYPEVDLIENTALFLGEVGEENEDLSAGIELDTSAVRKSGLALAAMLLCVSFYDLYP